MKKLINDFPLQLEEAIKIGKNVNLTNAEHEIRNVIICGLGGSGIGGAVISNVLESDISIPIIINKKYTLPSFANKNTLVIISSYSGNTEETLFAFNIAIKKKCKIIAITSGGKVEEICRANNFDIIKIPGGFPPRTCVGYSMTQILFILNSFNLINNSFINSLENVIELLNTEKENIHKEASNIANEIFDKRPIIYAADKYEAVTIRFKQQLNENSKILCSYHVLPEMNHNELVGWRTKDENLVVLFFRNTNDLKEIQTRLELSKKIISKYTSNIIEIWSKGHSDLEKSIYLIHMGDWISYYLSILRQVDTTEIEVINYLKTTLAKKID